MECYLVGNELGFFILDEGGRVVDRWVFPGGPEKAVKAASTVKAGGEVRGFTRLLRRLTRRGVEKVIVDDRTLRDVAAPRVKVPLEYRGKVEAIEEFKKRFPHYAVEEGVVEDEGALEEFLRRFTVAAAREAVSEEAARRDLTIVQMVRAIDDLDKSINLFAGRIREWYGLHFPELDGLIDSHETYLRIVEEMGGRGDWPSERLDALGISSKKSKTLQRASKTSMGGSLDPSDLKMLQTLCSRVLDLYRLRGELEGHLNTVMKATAPNTAAIVGSLIGARLISLAGGLENLAKMPASTIQVLGAEKALFRSLKTGSPPPKHGVIFQYAPLHQSPRWQRGKIARSIASKIAIASRLDAFGGGFEGERLKESFEERLREIEEKYGAPPPRSRKTGGRRRPRRT